MLIVSPCLGGASLITPLVLLISRQYWKLPGCTACIMPTRSSTAASSPDSWSQASSSHSVYITPYLTRQRIGSWGSILAFLHTSTSGRPWFLAL